jgi:hypothetical protein
LKLGQAARERQVFAGENVGGCHRRLSIPGPRRRELP